MTNSKSTKRALVSSALAILMCVAMLIGTTFAWFTDTASTGVNKITSGNLHVEIQDEASEPIATLEWVAKDGRPQDEILWEPGATYTLTPFKIVNTGKLALKYKMVVTGLDGDADLLRVIKFTYTAANGTAFDLNAERALLPNEDSGMITVSATMDKNAGNEYMDMTLEGVEIKVYATQEMHEYDSNGKNYDAKAEYAVSVTDQAGLDKALASDAATKITIEEGADVEINGVTYAGKNPGTTVENRGTLTVSGATIYSTDTAAQGRAAITNYGTLTVENSTLGSTQSRGNAIRNYGTATVKNSNLTCCDNYLNGGYAYVFATSAGTLTVENCTYEGKANGVFAADGGEIIINSGSYKLTGDKSFHMFYMEDGKITVNGGTFEKSGNTRDFAKLDGTGTLADHLTINGGTFTFNGADWTLN